MAEWKVSFGTEARLPFPSTIGPPMRATTMNGEHSLPPIDPLARTRGAQLLESFSNGELSSDALEDRWPDSSDPALDEIRRAVWLTYDDFEPSTEPLRGGDKELVGRCSRFLQTNQPWAWPVPRTWQRLLGLVVSLVTLGQIRPKWAGPGVDEPWPFTNSTDDRDP
jgi:hypothetical protein